MSYRVLALKYRPQTFEEVLGQPHVTTTLTNAISADRLAHAILLTGPRGTGKTTIARILAKAMNCTSGPTPIPCNHCKSCISITAGNAVDVFEIDGASNNSVDQIRELRENVAYMPSSSKFKIYIIDEVHMLSMAAFNALLKTLEEPPDHVLFIFATTEVHKIPVTILSRCQRHDLGRITLSQISAHLMKVSAEEGFTISRESCDLLASEADGSMRDSLSLLDRILGSCDKKELVHEEILNNLGIIDKTLVFDLAEAVVQNNGSMILDLVDRVHNLGLDLKRFYASLIRHFRNLAVVKISGDKKHTCDISDHDRKKITTLTAPLSQAFLNQILNTLLTDESLIKSSSHTKTAVEMVLLKLVQIRPGMEIDEIIKRLDDLAKRFDNPNFQPIPEYMSPVAANCENLKIRESEPLKKTSPRQSEPQENPPGQIPAQKQNEPRQAWHPQPHPQPQQSTPQKLPPKEQSIVPPGNTLHTWNALLKAISGSQPFLSAILSKGRLQKISDTDIVVELNGTAFDMGRIQSKQAELESICHDFFGKHLKLKIIGDCAPKEYTNDEKTPAKMKQEILNHPLVADAIKYFNGNVVDIKLNQRSQS